MRIGNQPASSLGVDQLLDFQVGLALDGQQLCPEECRRLLDSTEGLVFLKGKWVEADRERIAEALDHWKRLQQEHAQGIDFLQGMRLLAGVQLDEQGAAPQEVTGWSRVEAGDWLRETLSRLRHHSRDEACQPGRDLAATLRPYQVEGVRWLWFMTEFGLGACLADDMGLGKTVQVIDLLLQRKRLSNAKTTGPSLLVVPASLTGNWRQELSRFAPQLRFFVAHRGNARTRNWTEWLNPPNNGWLSSTW